MGPFFLGTLTQNSLTKSSESPAKSKLDSELWPNSELHLEVVAPRFEEIQGRQRGKQQTLDFRYRRRSPTELGYRGECPTYRPLPVLSLSLSIWSGSAFRDFLHLRPPTDVKYTHHTYN